jgi:hypothetical protein
MLENNVITTGHAIEVYYEPSGGFTQVIAASWETSLNTGQWYYVVGVHDADADTLTLYVDSVQRAQNTEATATPDTGDTPFRIADVNVSWATNEFNGQIDEVRVVSGVRSATWVETSYNNQKSPAAFYNLGNQETPGVDPVGNEMSTLLGSGASALVFDDAADEAYWYTDITYPTGNDDANLVAGNYALNMYFDQLPGDWWDTDYLYRKQITVTTTSAGVDAGYSVDVTFNHANLVPTKSLSSGNDVRVVHWTGSGWTELDRTLEPTSSWNDASTQIWFALEDAISSSSSDNNYYLYYGNSSAGSPPDDWANIFMVGDDFNDSTLTSGLSTSTAGTASITESGGEATIDLGTNEATDAGIIVKTTELPTDNQFVIRHETRLLSGGGASNPEVKNIGIQESTGQAAVDTSLNENPRRRIIDFTGVDTNAQIYYFSASEVSHYWDGSAWQSGNGFWGNLSLNTDYIHELVSDGTDWYVRITDDTGTEIESTASSPILWSNTNDTGQSFWFYWGEIYTNFYYADQASDWVYVRDYVNPEPTTSLSVTEDDAPFVDIAVSVYDTNSGGGTPHQIVTSSSIRIDASVGDPYALPIGSGAEQTYTAADPRRLRVHIDATNINGGGSFTLAYDSVANPSSLETPAMTIPEGVLPLIFMVALMPILMGLIWRKRRLALILILLMIMISTQLVWLASKAEAYTQDSDPSRMIPYTTPLLADDASGLLNNSVYGPGDARGNRERLDLRTRYSKTWQVFANGAPTDHFILETSLAPIHYLDSRNQWQVIDTRMTPSSRNIAGFGNPAWEMTANDYALYFQGEVDSSTALVQFSDQDHHTWVQFTPHELQWANTLGAVESIATPAMVNTIVSDNQADWQGIFGSDVNLRMIAGINGMQKWVDIASPLQPPSDDLQQGGDPVLEFVEAISLPADLSIWVDGSEWNRTSDVIASGEIVFRNANGEMVFVFPPPMISDLGSKSVYGQYRLMNRDGVLYSTVRVPLSWLQDAVYPISIDPTVNLQVGAATDDCDRWGDTDLHTEYLSVYLDYTDTNQSDGMRFTNVAVPNGAMIDTAYLTLRARNTQATVTGGTTIKGQDHDDPPTFTQGDYAEYDARVRTAASVYWQPSAWAENTDYNSPEIKTVVQEIVDRSGWTSGNAMVMFFEADQVQDIQAFSYDGNSTYAPKLHIEYSPSKSLVYKVGASSDDCDRDDVNWTTTTQTFYLDWDSVGQADGVRFTNVIVPKGATIVSAHLRIRAWDTASPITGGTTIYGQAADNPLTFSTAGDFNARTWTTANVYWQPSVWTGGTYYNSPDISNIIQEITERSGWASGNAMAFKLDGDEVQHIYGYSYDFNSGQYAPELHIEYSMYDSLVVQPGQSSDDVDHDSKTWDLTTEYFYLDWDNPARSSQSDGLRFPSVAVPDGATIVQAYFIVRARDDQSSGIGGATIYGQDADSPPTFTTTEEYEARSWISSPTVHWEPQEWIAEVEYDSPDVSGIIQAIIDRPGWSSGQAMAFMFDGDEDDNVDGYSWDYNSGQYAPRLYIEYTVAPAAPLNCQATFVSDSQIDVTWDDNSYNESGFKIESSVDGGGFSQIDTVGANTETYPDTSTSADHSYQYRVRAYNGNGDSSYCTATSTIYTSPDAPSSVSASHTADLEITITWTDNSSYEDQFRIERSKNGSAYVFLANDTDGSPFVDNTITQEEYDAQDEFTYRVRAEISSQGRSSTYVVSNTIVVPERLISLIGVAVLSFLFWDEVKRRKKRSKKHEA